MSPQGDGAPPGILTEMLAFGFISIVYFAALGLEDHLKLNDHSAQRTNWNLQDQSFSSFYNGKTSKESLNNHSGLRTGGQKL